jgi:L-asparaginase/Glu-tRNA(Gln) amidotransferase subunit D
LPDRKPTLINKGAIFAGALDGPKARILLILLLMTVASRDDIEKAFAEIALLSGYSLFRSD